MLVNCVYDNKPCTINDFQLVYSSSFGNCYSFNTNSSSLKTKRAGMNNGLKLELFTGSPEFHPCWMHEFGIILAVHNRTWTPVYKEDGLKLSTGISTNIVIKRRTTVKLPKPYSSCIQNVYSFESFDSEYCRITLDTYHIYRQKICLIECATALNQLENKKKCPQNYEKCLVRKDDFTSV